MCGVVLVGGRGANRLERPAICWFFLFQIAKKSVAFVCLVQWACPCPGFLSTLIHFSFDLTFLFPCETCGHLVQSDHDSSHVCLWFFFFKCSFLLWIKLKILQHLRRDSSLQSHMHFSDVCVDAISTEQLLTGSVVVRSLEFAFTPLSPLHFPSFAVDNRGLQAALALLPYLSIFMLLYI